jgi:hypothetical protein
MTTSSNDSASTNPADRAATAASPASDTESSADVTSTGGMAAGSEGSGADAGYIDDSQLPEELRPDAEGMEGGGAGDGRSLAEGATEEAGQLPDSSPSSPDGVSDVSEPTG